MNDRSWKWLFGTVTYTTVMYVLTVGYDSAVASVVILRTLRYQSTLVIVSGFASIKRTCESFCNGLWEESKLLILTHIKQSSFVCYL